MADKIIVLVTGANGGIGLELAAQLAEKNTYHVLMGTRSLEKGKAALEGLKSRVPAGSIEVLQIDVTDDDSIDKAAETVKQTHGRLDILVNNAAITSMNEPNLRKQINDAFNTNATGVAVVTQAFEPLLKQSNHTPRILNVSSGAGSITRRMDSSSPMYKMQQIPYRASKSALNMVTACQSVEYESLGWKVFAYCPGFTVSNLSSMNTAESGAKPTAEAVRPMVDVLEGKRDDENGQFLHNTGVYPW